MEERYFLTYVQGKLLRDITVRAENGRIVSIKQEGGASKPGMLLPGLIDVHIHGARGCDTMRGERDVRGMANALVQDGVTSFYPTTMNASPAVTNAALRGVMAVMQVQEEMGACVLGAHMEGPFLNAEHKGAQDEKANLLPTLKRFDALIRDAEACVKLITLAPELEGAMELIRVLNTRRIRVSAGHTGASAEVLTQAAQAGVTQVTHLFNGMNALNHRAPGVPGEALINDALRVQVIADGIHLHPKTLELIHRTKKPDGVILITDAMEAQGMADGEYALGGATVTVKDGAARLAQGNLAGSTLRLCDAVGNMVRMAGASAEEAIAMATENPALAMGLTDRGILREGAWADLTVMDDRFRVSKTIRAGKCVYTA